MKKNSKYIGLLSALLLGIFWVSTPVEAAGEKIHFGSEEYQWNLNEVSPIGAYAGAEDAVLSAEMTVLYDTEKLEYVSGGELIEPGEVKVRKSGTGEEEVMEMLQFLPKTSGTTQVTIQSAVIDTETGQTTVENPVNAPVKIPVVEGCKLSNILINGKPVEEFQSDTTEYEVKVSGETKELNIQAEPLDAQTKVEVSPINLKTGENTATIIATSLSGDKAAYELTIIKPEVQAQPAVSDNEGTKQKEEILSTNETPSDNQNLEEAVEKDRGNLTGRMIALLVGLTVVLLLLIVGQFILSHKKKMRRKKKRKKVATKVSPALDEKTENIELSRIQEDIPVIDNREVEINVKHVTMEFKKEKDESSSIKELAVRTLKGQRHVEKFKALDDVSFTVKKGEVVGIIGTNGSGKSTILKIISGVLTPTKGTVEVDKSKIQLLTLGTGFDFELTGRENVYLNGAVIGYTKEFIDEKYDEIVKFAELEGFMEQKVRNYSSGMVSRLGFAIATVRDTPEILILDEVLSVGDMFFRKKSEKRIKEMMQGGSTVLIVSHSPSVIKANCSKAVWIEKGVLKAVGRAEDVCRAYEKMNG